MKKKVKILAVPKAVNGFQMNGDQGDIQQESFNPLDGGTTFFNGPSHDNGGIDIKYGESPVEVEGDETGFVDSDDRGVIFGNLKIPGTDMKFKTFGKKMAKQEQGATKQLGKSSELLDSNDPYNKYGSFGFNSGIVNQDAAMQKFNTISQKKEMAAQIQDTMLNMAERTGMDPKDVSGMFKKGGRIAKDGMSLAQRLNNPGNLKFAPWMTKFGAVKGELSKEGDGTYFAKFPDTTSGQQAMAALLDKPLYKNKTVDQALNVYTGGAPYANIPSGIRNKQIGSLNPDERRTLYNTITQGEDSKLYNWDNLTPAQKPTFNVPLPDPSVDIPNWESQYVNTPKQNAPTGVIGKDTPTYQQPTYTPPPQKSLPSLANNNKLGLTDILPEIGAMFQRPDFVPLQVYNPNLYQPYQVSFQDRLNRNNSSFRALSQGLANNPEALSVLAAQKYDADNQVLADQFRTNQGIQNDVVNKNVGLMNDAEMRNIQLRDTQFMRQAQATANTRAQKYEAIASLSNKFAQNQRDNNNIRLVENQFNYRFNPQTGRMEYVGPQADFNYGNIPTDSNQKVTQYRDANGKIIKTVTEEDPYKAKKYAAKVNSNKYGGKLNK